MARARLIWTTPALDDLDDIAARVALAEPTAATALVRRAIAAVERLRRFPDSGRYVPELGRSAYREVIVPPCRIIYRREGGYLFIVHVFRGEQSLRRSRLARD